jgi:hypothetical protein
MLLLLPLRRCICANLIVLMQIRLLERALLEAKKQKPEGCYFTFYITRHTRHTSHVTRVLQPQPDIPRRWLWRRRAAAVHARQAMMHAVQFTLNLTTSPSPRLLPPPPLSSLSQNEIHK